MRTITLRYWESWKHVRCEAVTDVGTVSVDARSCDEARDLALRKIYELATKNADHEETVEVEW